MFRNSFVLFLGFSLLSFSACSDDTSIGGADLQVSPKDAQVGDGVAPADSAPSPDTAPACRYPEGPYGTTEGKVIENIEFSAFSDPNYLCKAAKDQVMDLSATRKISFKDFYCSSSCSAKKRKILWVMVSAGWCGPCQSEVAETQANYGKGDIDSRVHLMNIVYEDDHSKPITESFAKTWAKNTHFQLSFPVGLDPTFRMGTYFDRNAVPFNMLVDLSTMKIIYRQTGGDLSAVGSALFKALGKM